MSSPELTSIIMPVYNANRTLVESVRSIVRQTETNWELLLIDDCSRDDSPKLMRDLAQSDERIRPIFLERNVGAARARNEGMRASRGRFIAFLDSDDLWHEEKLAKQIATMAASGAGISFTDYEWIDAAGTPLGVVVRASDSPTWRELTWGNNIGLSTSMLDRNLVGAPEMLDLHLNHDYALWLQLLRRGITAVRIPEILVKYRVLPGSLSQNKFESAWFNWVILHRLEKLSTLQTLPRLFVWALRTGSRRMQRRRVLG